MKASESSEAGFTIIESLMAIVVVSILMAAIAPVLALSVANRVQARRVELASQAARAYIDGVRSGSIPTPNQVVTLTEVSGHTFSSARLTFADTAAPSASLSCGSPTNGYCTNSASSSLYCIDRDGGGCATSPRSQDLVAQAFRSTTTGATTDQGYLLAVRVYRADAFQNGSTLKTMKRNNSKASTVTGGFGDRLAPLTEITSEVASGKTKFQDYCTRFGGCQ
ncbi:hormogonium polysaccharide secretion pseudopilin HpsB [Cylindrospermum stagnale]|nr:hormogonium polysaccharide secretion pseudopilin HpsB [Cylindrospermum stagnale]